MVNYWQMVIGNCKLIREQVFYFNRNNRFDNRRRDILPYGFVVGSRPAG